MHLLKIVQTQQVGQHFSQHTKQAIRDAHVLSRVRAYMLLRKLQRAILAYLWRPGGTMMHRTYLQIRI